MDEDLLTIGAFSRATLLSPKALRGYHESGLLVPAVVDARTGYRGYTPGPAVRPA
ncbi:MerR family DNA-binding transcriptional regulator [Pseudonocardia benzenivorans]|uniref:MerR family DNA-binding transcriptional regulator n=1 Tax=Pseudonocardia benzenivorans TaxID=228005 RepID=A0ABW3VHQ3_9PSEU